MCPAGASGRPRTGLRVGTRCLGAGPDPSVGVILPRRCRLRDPPARLCAAQISPLGALKAARPRPTAQTWGPRGVPGAGGAGPGRDLALPRRPGALSPRAGLLPARRLVRSEVGAGSHPLPVTLTVPGASLRFLTGGRVCLAGTRVPHPGPRTRSPHSPCQRQPPARALPCPSLRPGAGQSSCGRQLTRLTALSRLLGEMKRRHRCKASIRVSAGPGRDPGQRPCTTSARAPPAPGGDPHRRHPFAPHPRPAGLAGTWACAPPAAGRQAAVRRVGRDRWGHGDSLPRQDTAPHSGKRGRPRQREGLRAAEPQPANARGATPTGDTQAGDAPAPTGREGTGSCQGTPLSVSPD